MAPLHIRVAAAVIAAASSVAALAYDPSVGLQHTYFAAAAYCDAGPVTNWTCAACVQSGVALSQVQWLANEPESNYGFVGATPDGGLVVSFRGTADVEQWLHDLDFLFTAFPGVSGGAEVHKGFYYSYLSLAGQLQAALTTLGGSQSIALTGHSLGAAIAAITTFELALAGYDVELLLNFGQPRVGNAVYVAAFNTTVIAGSDSGSDDPTTTGGGGGGTTTTSGHHNTTTTGGGGGGGTTTTGGGHNGTTTTTNNPTTTVPSTGSGGGSNGTSTQPTTTGGGGGNPTTTQPTTHTTGGGGGGNGTTTTTSNPTTMGGSSGSNGTTANGDASLSHPASGPSSHGKAPASSSDNVDDDDGVNMWVIDWHWFSPRWRAYAAGSAIDAEATARAWPAHVIVRPFGLASHLFGADQPSPPPISPVLAEAIEAALHHPANVDAVGGRFVQAQRTINKLKSLAAASVRLARASVGLAGGARGAAALLPSHADWSGGLDANAVAMLAAMRWPVGQRYSPWSAGGEAVAPATSAAAALERKLRSAYRHHGIGATAPLLRQPVLSVLDGKQMTVGTFTAAAAFRVTHYADVVPHVPPEAFGYVHAPEEVWYTEDSSNFTRCSVITGEDGRCSDSLSLPTSIEDHLHYLNVPISNLC